MAEKIRRGPAVVDIPELLDQIFSHRMQDDQILWIHAFASPSLRTISAYGSLKFPNGEISISALSVVLGHLKQTSPSLETLATFPISTDDIGEQDSQHPWVSLLWQAPFYSHLAGLSSLRHLVTNTSMLSPEGISTLGALPRLTSLDLSPKHYDPDVATLASTTLPCGSFPALRRLSLHFLSFLDIREIWRMEPMINRLSTLDIELARSTTSMPLNVYSFFEVLFPRICACSPGISNFAIDLGGIEGRAIGGPRVVQAFAQHSRALPLQQVSIGRCLGVVQDDDGAVLQVAWAGVRQIKMPHVAVTMDGISRLAALPMLERLAASLPGVFTNWEFPSPEQVHAGSTAFHTLELGDLLLELEEPLALQSGRFKDLARYLLALWPNLQHVRWFEDTPRQHPGSLVGGDSQASRHHGRQLDDRFNLDELNAHISTLRAQVAL
ncbi:hypothetical protein FRC06_007027 [Ceratobasidium sp. 370]|nr:hypothetical protein FRC06_007027 [Ceratobasidium sp. 370]